MTTRKRARQASAIVILALATPVQAEWPDSSSTNLSLADLPDSQVQPKLRVTDAGGAYLSWFDNSAGGYDVRLQRLDALGNELWAHNGVLIADRSFSSTQDYDLDIDTLGNALLTFRDDRLGGTQITATKVSPSGVQLWGATGVQLTSGTDSYAAPKIAGTTDGQVVVAWTNNSDVKLQKLDAAGVAQWGAGVTIPAIGGTGTTASDMDASDEGGVIVSMVRGFMSPKHLHAQKLDADGNFKWGVTPLAVYNGGALQTANFPQFVPDGNGGAVFTWYSISSGLQCHAQWIKADRTEAFGHNGAIVSTTPRDRTGPDVAFNPLSSETIVFWREEEFPGMFGIFGQKLGPTGTRLWGDGAVEIVPMSSTEVGQVRVAGVGDGAAVLWVKTLAFAQQTIHAALLDNAGNFDWTHPSTTVSSVLSGKSRLAAAATPAGALLAVWSDSRDDSDDVYGQRIAADGALGNGSALGRVADLTVDRLAAGSVRISWAPSCGAAQDYAIYEGSIGLWYDHTPADCADDGSDLEETIVTGAGDRYFLVVPMDSTDEGSYGTDSDSTERPPGSASCLATQNLTNCP